MKCLGSDWGSQMVMLKEQRKEMHLDSLKALRKGQLKGKHWDLQMVMPKDLLWGFEMGLLTVDYY